MPGEEGRKVSGNHKGKKGKGSGGAPNPLAAIRGPVLTSKASLGADTKGASHTPASETKGASHTPASETKGASNTQLLILKKGSKGASHTVTPKFLVPRRIRRKLAPLKDRETKRAKRILVIPKTVMNRRCRNQRR